MFFSILTTGGTIDKVYDTGLSVQDLHIGEPVVPQIIQVMLGITRVEHTIVFRKDSLDITEGDRQDICHELSKTCMDKVLITHGTDTLVQTAQKIKQYLQEENLSKRVVIFGSSQPACMVNSDALARIGFALGVLLSSPEPGVIIAMDGIHTNLRACKKGKDGIFRS
jgi:L-asparaginase